MLRLDRESLMHRIENLNLFRAVSLITRI
jgi:hypothetical protein